MTIKRTLGKEIFECSTLDKNTQGRKQSMKNTQISNTKKLTAKDRAKIKIVEYLSNSDNAFIPCQRLCTEVCGYKNSRYLYVLFMIEERREIEQTALDERRKNYIRQSAAVDYGLLKKAISGDAAAAKLWYQRFEGWSEKQQREYLDEKGVPQKIALQTYNTIRLNLMTNDERAKARREEMIKQLGPEREV